MIFILGHGRFFRKFESQLQSSPRIERPVQTLALMPDLVFHPVTLKVVDFHVYESDLKYGAVVGGSKKFAQNRMVYTQKLQLQFFRPATSKIFDFYVRESFLMYKAVSRGRCNFGLRNPIIYMNRNEPRNIRCNLIFCQVTQKIYDILFFHFLLTFFQK